MAVKHRCKEIAEFLIEYRAQINELDDQGKSVLHLAARMDSVDIIKVGTITISPTTAPSVKTLHIGGFRAQRTT